MTKLKSGNSKPARAILLDASCVLAWLFEEDGSDVVEPVLTTSYITAVNMTEVIRTVNRMNGDGLACAKDLVEAGLTVVPFTWSSVQAMPAIRHAPPGKGVLSLGDACCIAYGLTQSMEIWTADRAWSDFTINATIRQIRQ